MTKSNASRTTAPHPALDAAPPFYTATSSFLAHPAEGHHALVRHRREERLGLVTAPTLLREATADRFATPVVLSARAYTFAGVCRRRLLLTPEASPAGRLPHGGGPGGPRVLP